MEEKPNKPNKPKKLIKEIYTPKEFEGVKDLERIKLNYYDYSHRDGPIMDIKGLFAGSFDINDDKYFVISKTRPAKLFSPEMDMLFVISDLYRGEDNRIISQNKFTSGHCKYDKTSFSLQNEVKKHVTKLKDGKLNDMKWFEERRKARLSG